MPLSLARSDLLRTLVIPLLLAVLLVADLMTPLGVAEWIFYLLPICLCVFVDRPTMPLWTAGSATLLIAAGYIFSPAGGDSTIGLINRLCGVVVMWFLAAAIYRYIASQLQMRRFVWLQEGQVRVVQQTRGLDTPAEVGTALLRVLVPLAQAQAGVVYQLEDGSLKRIAGWAAPADTPERLALGETLAGQAASENRPLMARGLSSHYLRLSSALGRDVPQAVLAAPLTSDGHVIGVVELGFAAAQQKLDDTVELIGRIAEAAGVALTASAYRARLEALLAQTQRQAEELQVQQEELRVSNEELEERGRALMESQARLETQQAELEQSNVQLEEHTQLLEAQKRDLLQYQAELAAGARALERANQYKSEFLANMSHELRTPLNSALILAKLLQDNKEGNMTPEQVRYAATIHSANTDLLNLINDILDLSKIEAGHLTVQPEPVDIEAVVGGLAQGFAPIAAQKSVQFRIERAPDLPATLVTDNVRLQQILRNLLSNAFKFTERGEVALSIARDGSDGVRFSVRDTGIGIPKDKQAIIFEAFQQADGTTSRRYGGTGLGLSISRQLAQLLNGTLAVDSEPGSGSTFTLTLPLEFIGPAAPAAAVSSVPPAPAAVLEAAAQVAAEGGIDVTEALTAPQPAPVPEAVAAAPVPAPRPAAPSTPITISAPPLHTMLGPAPIDDDRGRRSRGNRLILVIEDDVAFAQILYDLAHELDFDCLHATTAQQGLELAREHQPCGILLDVALPDHSGLTLLDWLKRDPATRHIPTHLVSISDHAEAALHRGAIGYTLKPSGRDDLASVIRELEARMARGGMRTVLVVEDDATLRESIRALLQSADIDIVTADTVSAALARLSERRFDCVVMDLALPDGSGHDLLEQMAADASYSMPPVIVYTGRQLSAEDEQQLRRHSKSIIIKGARSPERLLDEVTLFLHSVESALPPEHQRMLRAVRSRDDAFEGRRLLLVEDDARNIFALSKVIEPLGAQVEIARNGRQALEILDGRDDIDLVLMDIMMPEMDGLTAMRHIRQDGRHARLPIIALTAKAMSSDREACLLAGANDYIAKPIDIDKLLSLCRVWLHGR
ncbi:response regulator [Cupriavidus gilardii]|uniref:response regulator n=1 Tax=Cupriavidus gilardii TaxID=82541 RepID=UPI001EE5C750|nr:response regulator [Cupriavidus gilardii]MCG5259097.1 response regulator [Cupriavidus gilardii]MDF9428819.1 response regulator [Cupriavidus gilardii]